MLVCDQIGRTGHVEAGERRTGGAISGCGADRRGIGAGSARFANSASRRALKSRTGYAAFGPSRSGEFRV